MDFFRSLFSRAEPLPNNTWPLGSETKTEAWLRAQTNFRLTTLVGLGPGGWCRSCRGDSQPFQPVAGLRGFDGTRVARDQTV